ncbi:IS1096 element passenger TnpR family protein [Pseudarthrobacter oxydans]|uniref:IS1096 element passenger TnpR family protein n=1 Tax=Pseudarthrobacter oxydans TaxID=1671 RepID=UPI0037F3247B
MPHRRGSWTAHGGAPLEDSGGIDGYHDLLDALADPGREEHKDLQAWVAWTAGPWQQFDPEQLDINAVNKELALLFPAPYTNEQGPGSPSLTQELTNRLLPGLRVNSVHTCTPPASMAPQRSKQTSPRRRPHLTSG